MTKADQPRFVHLVTAMAETFRREVTDSLIEGYWIALGDMDLEAFESGVKSCLRACKFMPAPADVRERAGGVPVEERAELAWECLLGAIRKADGSDVEFEDGAIARIVDRMGGWERVSGLTSDELLKWGRKEFLAVYAGMVREGVEHGAQRLAGWLAAGSPKGCKCLDRIAAPYLARQERIGA